jgi:multidrug transporter EmrE-like cation transporter
MNAPFSARAMLLAVAAALFSACGIVLLKIGIRADPVRVLPLATGLLVYGIGVLLGIVLVARHALSVAYSVVVGLSLAMLSVLSAFALHEALTLPRLVGTLLIVLGVVLLVKSEPGRPRT